MHSAMSHWIIRRDGILGGKPYVRGTRLTVEAIERKLAGGATVEDLLAAHPELTREGLNAARRHVVQVVDKGILRPSRHDHRRPGRRREPSPVAEDIFTRDG